MLEIASTELVQDATTDVQPNSTTAKPVMGMDQGHSDKCGYCLGHMSLKSLINCEKQIGPALEVAKPDLIRTSKRQKIVSQRLTYVSMKKHY